ncbi:hypothetical protein LZ198_23710 [Myxococcus sp. K15C18031901]|uniref:hypothetical protein n=1 Tax=Myxococcus dinghuensis TaxID=2906761 RepID=UPI0020A782A2|nr:hypothetical protein [Myxococcus dinghuensis]MCP3101888.1 hypothetical protein [Myxococcus dinghuensis]
MKGVPLKVIQELMGHATLDISPQVKQDAVKRLPPMLPLGTCVRPDMPAVA